MSVLASPDSAPPVLAAGAVVWRQKKDELQVLLVHRPRYDDWSFPKGKLDPGETFPGAAVREVAEETGYRVRLLRPLPTSMYLLRGNRTKIVQYWSAQVRSRIGPGPKNPREIDEIRWVEIGAALDLVTRSMDRVPLTALKDQIETETAHTRPILIQRHAAARSRAKWRDGEGTRPLSSKGKKQSVALPDLIAAFDPGAVLTSPWERCRATVQPFARQAGLDLMAKDSLTEASHAAEPSRTAAVIERVIQEARPVIVCTHRPVLPTVIDVVREYADASAALELPVADPYLAAGEALVLHTTEGGRIVAVERHQPNLG